MQTYITPINTVKTCFKCNDGKARSHIMFVNVKKNKQSFWKEMFNKIRMILLINIPLHPKLIGAYMTIPE